MSTQFLGQIQIFGFPFAPKNWALCNGQTMAINQNQALFALLGTTYGGNGIQTFALPNLQGAFALHQGTLAGNGYVLGQTGGEVNHTLIAGELPAHNHLMAASNAVGTKGTPVGNFPAQAVGTPPPNGYGTTANVPMGTGSNPNTGGQPHPNMPPYAVLNFCIALVGIFPSRN
jgi:microcystin-dependent protein